MGGMPPLQLSVPISSSAQSGARADSYQAGVSSVSPFGDFNIVGGGRDDSQASLSPAHSTKALVFGDNSKAAKPNTALIVGGLVLAGVAVWLLMKKKK
jgi:LPXTG-motif cell wall-anchored protein